MFLYNIMKSCALKDYSIDTVELKFFWRRVMCYWRRIIRALHFKIWAFIVWLTVCMSWGGEFLCGKVAKFFFSLPLYSHLWQKFMQNGIPVVLLEMKAAKWTTKTIFRGYQLARSPPGSCHVFVNGYQCANTVNTPTSGALCWFFNNEN